MRELKIYDVSAMVNTGGSHKEDFFGYPVGGIHYVLNRIAVDLVDRNCLVLCFDSPSFRKGLYTQYKSGRERRPGIYSQIETLYEGLQQCGIRCEKYDGFEADDVVEWAVVQNYEEYVRGTIIYSNDVDLCHSIRNGVCLYATNPAMNDINQTNFSTEIKRGEIVPYNTVSAYKVFCGCSSDKIPSFKMECGLGGRKLFDAWCAIMQKIGPLSERRIGANPSAIKAFVNGLAGVTENDKLELEKRIQLVFPAEAPEGTRIEPVVYSDVDVDKLRLFMGLYGSKAAMKCMGMRSYSLTDEDKALLREKAKSLMSGAYAADKNLMYDTKNVRSQVIDLDAFTRGY